MNRALLSDLNMSTRKEVLIFIKKLWNVEEAPCPICHTKLELLHHKSKNDWHYKKCLKIYKTLSLLDELSKHLPINR